MPISSLENLTLMSVIVACVNELLSAASRVFGCFREKSVQIHLKNVYSLLSVGLIAASIGSFVFTTSSLIQVNWTVNIDHGNVGLAHLNEAIRLSSPFLRLQYWGFSVLLLSAIASIASCCYVMFTEHTESRLLSRMVAFLVFTLSTGALLLVFLRQFLARLNYAIY